MSIPFRTGARTLLSATVNASLAVTDTTLGFAGGTGDADKSVRAPSRNFGICAATAALYRASASFHFSIGVSSIADATTVATFARSGVTSPLPSGWTRFERKTTKVCDVGSIQIDVPVKPVCPNDPNGNSSPRFDEKEVLMSHPSPRVAPSSLTTYGWVILAMV